MNRFLVILLLILCSCAKTPAEKIAGAIDVAETLLSEQKCDEAIKLLESVGVQNSNPIYLQVYASAYACRASYDEIAFVANDIPHINTGGAQLMDSLSVLTLSPQTIADSSSYKDLRTALNILLYADGGAQPSQAARAAAYGTRKAGDMGIQILLLTVTQLGKFLNYYGNVSVAGVKGGGSGASNCFIDYTYNQAQAVITGGGNGACTTFNHGHTDLSVVAPNAATGIRRRCEGLMLLTNLIDVLNNIDVSGITSLASLATVATDVNAMKTAAITADPTLGVLLNTTSQSVCESTLAAAAEMNNMELIYALLFEKGLQ